ncbi:type III secretion protein [Dyella sp. M7H15-1]|uniref:type III secretion protein n=1 Tax=Dyella sp. M7H15-1 TaxID=2501295 RepID=UPI0010051139|nr:type III secretion protein [Dyella sp. M7H15-1]QAU24327.1 type III secretion protein [Dyella sp. M7H15-1]
MDAVTRYLQAAGFDPKPERFLGSDFLLGQTIVTERFSLTYRQEEERLVLCDFATRSEDGQAVSSMLALIKRLLKSVPAVRVVEALILPASRQPELDRTRRRLAELFVAEGAKPVEIDGQPWLRYSRR